MTSRIAARTIRTSVALARPTVVTSLPRIQRRSMATEPTPPAERAQEIIQSVPSTSLVTKTGAVVLGTALTATAISQELYVANDETVVLAGFLVLTTYLAKALQEPYKGWAQGHIDRISNILATSRAEHTQAVKDRISSVEQMKDVVDLTKGLFAVSKETAQLESEIFAKRQQVAMAAELKQVLDSWVRYEQQAKEAEQAELAKTVIERVLKTLQDERSQKDILLGAVSELEVLVKNKAI